mmetsp:Transcript_41689/g.126445  ORF Transcript_41689/g.126445 Transcript_41689/m.126445 type:complete len:321 (+) Transcript_41689:805-1767(+)
MDGDAGPSTAHDGPSVGDGDETVGYAAVRLQLAGGNVHALEGVQFQADTGTLEGGQVRVGDGPNGDLGGTNQNDVPLGRDTYGLGVGEGLGTLHLLPLRSLPIGVGRGGIGPPSRPRRAETPHHGAVPDVHQAAPSFAHGGAQAESRADRHASYPLSSVSPHPQSWSQREELTGDESPQRGGAVRGAAHGHLSPNSPVTCGGPDGVHGDRGDRRGVNVRDEDLASYGALARIDELHGEGAGSVPVAEDEEERAGREEGLGDGHCDRTGCASSACRARSRTGAVTPRGLSGRVGQPGYRPEVGQFALGDEAPLIEEEIAGG